MASQKQIEANRRNAQRSTGPRTPEGKSVSRYNGLDTGLYADREVVLPTEDPSALVRLAEDYHHHFDPQTPQERYLVDCLVSDEWLTRRFRRIEGEMMTRSCQDVEGRSKERFCLADAYDENDRALERLQRRINATRRSYLKTLESLKKLQAEEEVKPVRKPIAQENQPLPESIGFGPTLSEPGLPADSARLRDELVSPDLPRVSASALRPQQL